jgi:hypothetical protein
MGNNKKVKLPAAIEEVNTDVAPPVGGSAVNM